MEGMIFGAWCRSFTPTFVSLKLRGSAICRWCMR